MVISTICSRLFVQLRMFARNSFECFPYAQHVWVICKRINNKNKNNSNMFDARSFWLKLPHLAVELNINSLRVLALRLSVYVLLCLSLRLFVIPLIKLFVGSSTCGCYQYPVKGRNAIDMLGPRAHHAKLVMSSTMVICVSVSTHVRQQLPSIKCVLFNTFK